MTKTLRVKSLAYLCSSSAHFFLREDRGIEAAFPDGCSVVSTPSSPLIREDIIMSCVFGSVPGLRFLFHCLSISVPTSLRMENRQQLFKPRGRCAAFFFLTTFFSSPFRFDADTSDILQSDVCSRYSSPHLMDKVNEEQKG